VRFTALREMEVVSGTIREDIVNLKPKQETGGNVEKSN
jgi:hypothetical protein